MEIMILSATIAAAAASLCILFIRRRFLLMAAGSIDGVLFVLLGIHLVQKSMETGFAALYTMYDGLVLFAAGFFGLYCWLIIRHGTRMPPLAVLIGNLIGIAAVYLASSPLFPAETAPPVPALRSAWLYLHVTFAFIGMVFFAAAFVLSIVRLVPGKNGEWCEKKAYAATTAGFLFYSLGGLIFGAVWAYRSWGRYWSWDPKETMTLVTWGCYALYLHVRPMRRRIRFLPEFINIAAFSVLIFTFIGIGLFPSSLHSY